VKRRLATLALTAFAVFSLAAPPVFAEPATVIADGHVDMGPRIVDGAWKIQIRDDSAEPATWRPLPEVILKATGASAMTVPPGTEFSFLGAPGAPVWLLPQVQRPGVLWPGWNTQDPSIAAAVNREVIWQVHAVQGPGHFALFLNGNFGTPDVVFDSAKPMPQETGIDAASHVHGNWAFSAAGGYSLDIEMRTKTPDGAELSDRGILRVFVGEGDAAQGFLASAPSTVSTAAPLAPETQSSGEDPAPDRTGWWLAAGAVVILAGAGGALWFRRSGRDS